MVGSQLSEEGSVIASLRELERLEEDRVRQEREASQRQRDAEDAARRDAEQRAESERSARARREEDAWLARARLERAEAARSAAMAHAIVERAKTEALARSVAEEREREHRRELERADAADARGLKRLRWVTRALAAALLVAIVGGGFDYWLVLAPRWAARVEAANAEGIARDGTIAGLRAKLANAEGETAMARHDLAGAATRVATLDAQATELRREIDRLRRPQRGAGPSGVHPPDTAFSNHCDPGSLDPLCGNIGR